jgi:hypothetical protein
MLRTRINKVLKTLSYREREIIKLRYGLGDGYSYTLEEVGHIFKVTRERIRQIEAKAVPRKTSASATQPQPAVGATPGRGGASIISVEDLQVCRASGAKRLCDNR